MLNRVILMGRLTRDPDLRRYNGESVVNFTVALDRPTKGEKKTDFIDVVVWGKRADWCTNWLEKGCLVIVVGSLRSRNWEDRHGNKRVSIEVQADEVQFGETKRAREANAKAPADAPGVPPDFTELSDDDDDEGTVPF